ncbi:MULTISPECIES: DUF6335 family protein [Cyanophyceae]|uniref:DUF6335 family protein n=1 Tax=Leptolyngbya subtilissima DQ-A4 TaxID=2933933 RepID=A0ABV0K6E5_9CYAN|nr:DUF6335 family protein [Nodosilinea sp. FACHB-141]MBD2113904.1 hypothetical protein [Nodosilinea sp. FACHB-141]
MNSQQSDLADKLLHEIDAAPPPSNEPVIHLPPSQAEVEEARVGQSDDSAHLGAEVTAESALETNSPLTGGDPDAVAERAETVGEEAVGGTTPTPEQNDVDGLTDAVGISNQPEHPVGVLNEMNRRDDQRFELDPDSKDPEY